MKRFAAPWPSPRVCHSPRTRRRRAIRTSRCGSWSRIRRGKAPTSPRGSSPSRLGKALGQSFFIENKPGAGGNIGTEAAARAAADGYTLTMGTNATHGTNQFLYDAVPFDPEKDFEPVILVGSFPMAIAANPSFAGQVDRRRHRDREVERPRAPTSRMPSTTARIVFELLKARARRRIFGIPYKGSATAIRRRWVARCRS